MAPSTRENPFQVREDKALVERLLAGDEAAFERFSADYFPGLYRFARSRLGGDEQVTVEVVQSTIAKAIEALDTYRGEAALFSWMCGICRNEIGALLRAREREPISVGLVEEAPEVRAVLESLALEVEGPQGELERKELARRVHLTLDHLPVRYGRALEWKYLEGLPVAEIAERLGVGPKAAESVLSRAREAFRSAFGALGEGLGGRGRRGLQLMSTGRSR